ncbi:MAG: hypothetical protein GJ680_21155 [Alteromonadaceae bacterium]|nr:hypothetical protein [Alteromonadaceae bacterium]
MIETVKVRNSGNSVVLPLSKQLREETALSHGDSVIVRTTDKGFEVEIRSTKKMKIQFPMSYKALIHDLKPDCDLLPLEVLNFD